ncbi:phage holin family protein [Erwiniaceae bacterium BAC15a-03b]|uniref:Phage holin family protein n=2 Tax=Winslowiella TaxID=2997349 RepID=A0A9J6PUD3_9GAMM|nr:MULTISPECIES: hypothetical protein [Winslowiella]MBP2167004.1 positive regulator of sigma E activity [Winslowiella toletana]MCU5775849.1 phage holin family protein [Winslowiella arboricola]MCU5779301.1 phage holin family protein [Winslowiella arboricola]
MEKNSSIISYLIGLLMMWASRHSVQDIAFMTGTVVALVTLVINVANFFINWHYRRKTYRLLKQQQMPDEVADEFLR